MHSGFMRLMLFASKKNGGSHFFLWDGGIRGVTRTLALATGALALGTGSIVGCGGVTKLGAGTTTELTVGGGGISGGVVSGSGSLRKLNHRPAASSKSTATPAPTTLRLA
jgi:hypothetical protein